MLQAPAFASSPAAQCAFHFGAALLGHGANNIYENGRNLVENRSDSEGWVRQGYQKAAQLIGKTKRVGNIAYYSADLGLSVWGMGRTVISPTARKLFRHIKNDYMRGIRTMTGKALTLEIAVDLITGKNLLWEIEKKDEHDH